MKSAALSPRDALLALAIVLVWGTNFALVRIDLNVLPPLLFAALRFTFVFVPAAFFLERPRRAGKTWRFTAWRWVSVSSACCSWRWME